jgi:hypothetical protein
MESRLYLEPWNVSGDTLEVAACLEQGSTQYRLWWRLPVQWQDAVTQWADPFLVGFIFPIMQSGGDALIEGNVSPSLLENLELYAAIWRAWFPDRYKPVKIRAQHEIESPVPLSPEETIVPFSCGVDSSFTTLRHVRGLLGRRNRKIGAAVVMHGFDIWLNWEKASAIYADLLNGAKAMLKSIDVPCIPVTSNFRELPPLPASAGVSHLIGGLMLFSGRFSGALIPNTLPYTLNLNWWGSHPVCDPHLGSKRFVVYDDGAENSRIEKVTLLSQWPQAMQHLHVCRLNLGEHRNCCKCEKCVRTILSFRLAGIQLPTTFKYDVTDRQIARMKFDHEYFFQLWLQLTDMLEELRLNKTSWGRAMLTAVQRYQRQNQSLNMRKRLLGVKSSFVPLRNQIRKIFRGSTLSRRELARAKMQPGAGRVAAPENSPQKS